MQPLTKKEFWDKYWFTPLQMVTIVNPKETDYPFMVEMRSFVIKAGATEQMPGTVANVYLSQMTKILAQDDEKMEHLSDFQLMKVYYDKLIVDVKSLMPEANTVPSYLKDVSETMKADAPETPPWQQPEEEVKEVRDEEKEFAHDGNQYKLVVSKGERSYFMNGKPTSEAIYSKAASML